MKTPTNSPKLCSSSLAYLVETSTRREGFGFRVSVILVAHPPPCITFILSWLPSEPTNFSSPPGPDICTRSRSDRGTEGSALPAVTQEHLAPPRDWSDPELTAEADTNHAHP